MYDDVYVEGILFGVGVNDVGEFWGYFYYVDWVFVLC